MAEQHRMRCARWDTGTGHSAKLQPLTLAFVDGDVRNRARALGGTAHPDFEIVSVLVDVEIDHAR